MNVAKGLNARFKGLRIYMVAALIALPDILNGLAGVDFTAVLPPGWGVRVGGLVAIARIVVIPMLAQAAKVGPAGEDASPADDAGEKAPT